MGERLTRAEAAEQLDVSRQRVEELIKEGRLPEQHEAGAGYFIDSEDVGRVAATLDIDKKRPASKPASDPQLELIARQSNLAKAKSAILKSQDQELELQIKKREYVPRSRVQAHAMSAGKLLTQRLQAACQQLAPQVCVLKTQEEALDLLKRVLLDGVLADFRNDIATATAD